MVVKRSCLMIVGVFVLASASCDSPVQEQAPPLAEWVLAQQPKPDDMTLQLVVQEQSCNGGRAPDGRIVTRLETEADRILVTVRARRPQRCTAPASAGHAAVSRVRPCPLGGTPDAMPSCSPRCTRPQECAASDQTAAVRLAGWNDIPGRELSGSPRTGTRGRRCRGCRHDSLRRGSNCTAAAAAVAYRRTKASRNDHSIAAPAVAKSRFIRDFHREVQHQRQLLPSLRHQRRRRRLATCRACLQPQRLLRRGSPLHHGACRRGGRTDPERRLARPPQPAMSAEGNR